MATSLRRSHSTPSACSLVGLSNQIKDDFRWPQAKPSQIYSRFVRDSFYPAHIQLQRSQSEANFGSYVPDRNLIGPTFGYRSQFRYLQHPARYKPQFEDGSRIATWRARTSPRKVYGDYHWPYYRRYIADEWNSFDYDVERDIDYSNSWRIYAPIHVVPYTRPWPNYVTRYDSYSYGVPLSSSAMYWRDYGGWRNYMNGLISGMNRRGTPFWRRVYSSIYPPLWHHSPFNFYYTHGYY